VDVWKYVKTGADGKELVARREKDLNGDAKVDSWEWYGDDGTLQRLVYDLDFDGNADASLFFEKDQLVRKEYAFGFDGVPRTFSYYERGKLVRKERDQNSDGKIDAWEYWEGGEIDRLGVDLDGDGQVDRWESRKTAQAEGEAAAKP
jgi:antitoxin component YwqK of YwqJK toxin-antitoxin module